MRRILLLILVTIIIFTTMPLLDQRLETAAALTDLKQQGRQEIHRLMDQNIITGFPDGTFRPDRPVTRAEATAMVVRALNLDSTQRPTRFPDVPIAHFASGAIAIGTERNIISGYPSGLFHPDQPVTRAEMAIILNRAFSFESTIFQYFRDVQAHTLGSTEINRLAANGVTAGYGDGTFRPAQGITRHEFALFLARTLYTEFRVKPPVPNMATKPAIVVNAPEGLNVRTAPNTNNTPIGKLSNGTLINYFAETNGWAAFIFQNEIAYVSLAYLEPAKGLKGRTIVIDPGHGGKDPGAVAFGLQEKDLVLAVGLRVQRKLEAAGVNVVMTRTTDTFLELAERSALANQANAHAFISIHANAAGSNAAHGTETYWNRTNNAAESKELAEKIQKHLISRLKTHNRGVKEANFHVIRETRMPSVLVELGFITNQNEANRMKTAQFHEEAAEAIFRGIEEFFY